MKYNVFVSYSHKDKNLVTTLVDRLESFGLIIFFDFRNLAPGGIWAELNCLLIDYTQMVNFGSVFSVNSGELEERVKQCRSKITEIEEQLKTGEPAQGKKTILVKAYRNFLGLARPEYPIYDVFISCKSEDEKYAHQVYDFLLLNGKRVFFSRETISALGNSEYHDAIMGALDHSRHFKKEELPIDIRRKKIISLSSFRNRLIM